MAYWQLIASITGWTTEALPQLNIADEAMLTDRKSHLYRLHVSQSIAPGARRRYATLREGLDANPEVIESYLSAAGFEDVSKNGLLALGAATMDEKMAADILRGLDISEQERTQVFASLMLGGYLAFRDELDSDGRTATAVTERGHEMLTVGSIGINAARWADFKFRPGDIVVSTPSKSGTTWMQMICALLIFGTPDLPSSLSALSPWLDGPSSRDEIYAHLAALEHRRFIKTHVPLNQIKNDPQVTYIVVGRHPLDAAMSMYQQKMVVQERTSGLSAQRKPSVSWTPRETRRNWLLDWIDSEEVLPYSLRGVLWHLSSAWDRKAEPNVVLLHYSDLLADLKGEMSCLADRLRITVPDIEWPSLVKSATFEEMRAAANKLQPLGDLLADNTAFFWKGASGSGRELLTDDEFAHYNDRMLKLASPEFVTWLHDGGQK